MSAFNESTLYISARSPFARRVRMAFQEHEISYEEKVLNVFESNPILEKNNPLRRVPVVVLKSGETVIDSSFIVSAFYDEKRNSPLLPVDMTARRTMFNWSGMAVGVCEVTVQSYLETLRLPARQDETLIKENMEILADSLFRAENHLANKDWFVGGQFSQADIDWACAIDYIKLRFPAAFNKNYQNLGRFMGSMAAKASFKRTAPPPP